MLLGPPGAMGRHIPEVDRESLEEQDWASRPLPNLRTLDMPG